MRGGLSRGGANRGGHVPAAARPAPPFDDSDDDDDDEWDDGEVEDWDEPESAPTKCLFTDQEFPSAAECLAHAVSSYQLDLLSIIRRLRLDMYDRMRLVNYLRSSVRKPGADTTALVASVVACEPGAQEPWPWSDDAYLQPVLADDPLLYTLSMDDEEQDEAEERADMLEAVSTRGAAHLSPAPAVGPG